MKHGEIQHIVRASREGGCLNSNNLTEDGFIALVAVPGDDTYEVSLKALKSHLSWKHVNLERAQLLNRTLPVEVDFDGRNGQPFSQLQITEETAKAWASKVTSLIESEQVIDANSEAEIIMAPSAIALAAIDKLNEKITNEVFLIIEKDPELRKEYDLIISRLSPKEVNRFIGRTVKDAYKLENADTRENSPSSTLISSHQKLKRPV